MRKLVYFTTVSLDGYFSDPDGGLDDLGPTPEEHQYASDLTREADALLFGRGTYEIMTYWDEVDLDELPPVEREFATIYRSKPVFVFSTTLPTSDPRATIIKEDIAGRVAELKAQDGSDLGLGCGPALLGWFLQNQLVDEVRLLIKPILMGKGVPLFGELREAQALRLESTRVFDGGGVLCTYSVPGEPASS